MLTRTGERMFVQFLNIRRTVSSSTGAVTIKAAAASGLQLNWSNEIML